MQVKISYDGGTTVSVLNGIDQISKYTFGNYTDKAILVLMVQKNTMLQQHRVPQTRLCAGSKSCLIGNSSFYEIGFSGSAYG